MAIGTIWVLLILVTSLAISYIRESRLSRYSYDEVIASSAAEGEFEYAMMKVRNHRDGFQDATFSGELDGNILDLSTPRSAGLHTQYNIVASSTGETFSLSGGQHLIVPLFAGTGTALTRFSKIPSYETGAQNTTGLNVSGLSELSWTITAMSGSESVAITGVGNIDSTTSGNIRIKASQCYAGTMRPGYDTWSLIDCSTLDTSKNDEELFYIYDTPSTIVAFLSAKTDPYFILYNPNPETNPPIFVGMSATTPFSLPTLTIRSTATKWESSQVFQFVEDKGKYYDALKYGVYNKDTTTP
jgi:hypothetical protein